MFHHTISLDKTNVFAICYVIILRSVIYGVKDYYTLYVTFVNKINAIFYYSGVMGFAENLRTELDMGMLEAACKKIAGYSYPPNQAELLERLTAACGELDMDACAEIVDEWDALVV